ncbi:hypothetical protein [Streptomyces sp. NPDC002187]|uniref:hypothetical protein n=1 Tax=Streptomyces sp. NPDC002187 TaxID=3364637 RepID=UPI0036C83AC7
MTTAQRVLAAIALATGASALAAPAANAAAPVEVPSVIGQLDSLAATSVPTEHRAQVPTVSEQVGGGMNRLGKVNQLTGQAAPALASTLR